MFTLNHSCTEKSGNLSTLKAYTGIRTTEYAKKLKSEKTGTVICRYCDKTFFPNFHSRIYCNDKCKAAYRALLRIAPGPIPVTDEYIMYKKTEANSSCKAMRYAKILGILKTENEIQRIRYEEIIS